jgi:single-stranded-DNA-specific exonuclease
MMELARVGRADAYAAGFILGPRLNAAGRMIDANIALDLILTDNVLTAGDLAGKLDDMNSKRQAVQNAILIDADAEAKRQAAAGAFCLCVSGEGWHGGVMGIVAGRLKEKYHLPCCVATKSDAVINGSGRSVDGVDLGRVIRAAIDRGMISSGGGHAAAAGFSLPVGNGRMFADFMNAEVSRQLGGVLPRPRVLIDAELDAGGASFDLARGLADMSPFGIGNPEPVLALSNGIWTYGRVIGSGAHMSGTLKTGAGTLPVVGFNMTDSPVGRFLLDDANFGAIIRVAGKLKENEYNGNVGIQLILEDAAI